MRRRPRGAHAGQLSGLARTGNAAQTLASGEQEADFLLGVALGTRDRYIHDLESDPDEYRITLSGLLTRHKDSGR